MTAFFPSVSWPGTPILLLKDSQHFQPCAFLFITLLPQGLMGVTTLGGLWVMTLTDLRICF